MWGYGGAGVGLREPRWWGMRGRPESMSRRGFVFLCAISPYPLNHHPANHLPHPLKPTQTSLALQTCCKPPLPLKSHANLPRPPNPLPSCESMVTRLHTQVCPRRLGRDCLLHPAVPCSADSPAARAGPRPLRQGAGAWAGSAAWHAAGTAQRFTGQRHWSSPAAPASPTSCSVESLKRALTHTPRTHTHTHHW